MIADILAFWFADGPDVFRPAWFAKDPAFDEAIRPRFGALLAPGREGALDGWAATPEGALALFLVLDQFPRNLHRGAPEAFASDAHALALARRLVPGARMDLALAPTQRIFLYLPFEHAEEMPAQDLSVALFEGLRDHPAHARPNGTIDYAWRHRDVIARFGRFPHRNAALGRESTAAELTYLAQPGAGF
ncbi:DUF924 family protein [Rubritepida flocculans]|uniref:DUF924 family protein n=1 Tax=Rubritepida flocculans TaxID=182403 RepID=UPI000421BFE1|nr:DUF924 family protein [Rubritepida flocculans]